MSTIERNPDVAVRPLLRFSPQFLNTDQALSEQGYVLKENIEKLVRVFAGELQELEDAIIDIMYNMAVFDLLDSDGNILVDKAFGKSLDVIAAVVGAEPRQGMTDDQYRAEIALQIAINTSKGNIIDVTNALKKITQATVVEWTDNFPAGIDLVTNGTYAGQEVISQITQILSAAVGFSLTYKNEDVGVFEFSDTITESTKKFICSVTNGSPTVTMADPTHIVKAGAKLLFEGTGITEFTVSSVSGTTVTLSGNFSGSTNSYTWCTIKSGVTTYSPSFSLFKGFHEMYQQFANTVSITAGSDSITINVADDALLFVGDYVFFNQDSHDVYKILARPTSTTATLDADYRGSTDASADLYIQRKDRTLTGTVDINGTAVTYDNAAADSMKVLPRDAVFFGGSTTGYEVAAVSPTGFTLSVAYPTVVNNIACAVKPHTGALVDIFF